jgi:gamma-glutamyltranspeptidase / glutathione hydrolase
MTQDLARYIVNPGPKKPVTGLRAAVTTDSAIVTEAMLAVLRRGGNAADAAVAGSLVQAATEPFVTNHAGQVTCLYYEARTGRIHQLDSLGGFPSGLPPFKPLPPQAATGAVLPSAIIPGFMPGMKEIHRRFGSRPWKELCAPAVEWAERGHPVSSFEYGSLTAAAKYYTYFPESREFYQPRGMFTPVGEVFVPRGLARTLRAVAEHGPEYMITGPWAERFVEKANEMGWKISMTHMTETPPRWLEPIRYRHHEYEIVTLGPPQAQGFIISVTLGVLKHLGIREMEPCSGEYFWAMGHALRQSARHWEYAQDETIYGVPREEILDDSYHAHLARMIRSSRPKVDLTEHIRLVGEMVGPAQDTLTSYNGSGAKVGRGDSESKQPTGSCEIAVVDGDGNWMQTMNTIQGSGIPGMVIDGVSMLGSNATFGRLMSSMDATLVKGAKGRCVLGNTIALRNGKPFCSAGTPGNAHCTIPQVLTLALDFGFDPYAAVDAPRMLPMDEDRRVTIEDRLRSGVVDHLHRLGVRVSVLPGYDHHMGSFSVITRDERTGLYTAVADPRRCAVADGIRP